MCATGRCFPGVDDLPTALDVVKHASLWLPTLTLVGMVGACGVGALGVTIWHKVKSPHFSKSHDFDDK